MEKNTQRPINESPMATKYPQTSAAEIVKMINTIQF